MNIRSLMMLVVVAVLVSGCSSEDVIEPDSPVVPEEKLLDPIPVELTESELSLSESASYFGIDFINAAEKYYGTDKNFVVSPMSASVLLSMLANATDEEATKQIADALGSDDIDALNRFNSKMLKELATTDPNISLEFANSLWYNNQLTLNSSVSNILGNFYESEHFAADFTDQDQLLGRINEWTADKTHGLINPLLKKLKNLSVAVLLNTLYFDGEWFLPFDKKNTQKAEFHGADHTSTVDMMRCQEVSAGYTDGGFWIARKEYGARVFDMVFILPPEDNPDLKLTSEEWKTLRQGKQSLFLSIPKFEVKMEDELKINDLLPELGLNFLGDLRDLTLFDEECKDVLFEILQKATIKVNEDRTVAAAATSADLTLTASYWRSYTLDRPFYFLVCHKASGTILFGGHIAQL